MLKKELIIEINNSFKNIALDDGVGYFQSLAIDNLIIEDGKEKFENEIKKDIKFQKNWNLLLEYLKENETDFFAFPFMDYKGIQYILPCLLILEYKDELCNLIPKLLIYKLWRKNIWKEILTNEQKSIIIKTFTHWNDENLSVLKSYGLTEKNANIVNEKDLIFKSLTKIKTNT